MHTVADVSEFSGNDRFGLTVFGSALIHLIFVLGITFTVPKILDRPDSMPTLEITLVQTKSDTKPDTADFLAQANQEGGGDRDEPAVPRSPLPIQEISSQPQKPPVARRRTPPAAPTVEPKRELITQNKPDATAIPRPEPVPVTPRPQPAPPSIGLIQPETWQTERARLSAELSQSWEAYQKRPRRKFISARTREYRYAAYMDAWRAKVERIGNLNYPEQAKRLGLTGDLVLSVALNPDGTVNEISIQRASGHKVLDDAATRIVRLASPFAPFPDEILAETDILHITRTWQFMRDSVLRSR